jgi:hypothetical protein
MTEPMIDETDARPEEFADELSDEALDREGARACSVCSRGGDGHTPEGHIPDHRLGSVYACAPPYSKAR